VALPLWSIAYAGLVFRCPGVIARHAEAERASIACRDWLVGDEGDEGEMGNNGKTPLNPCPACDPIKCLSNSISAEGKDVER
jgi:hypothetical protein